MLPILNLKPAQPILKKQQVRSSFPICLRPATFCVARQDEYESYMTPILFFKRLSDVYDEETHSSQVIENCALAQTWLN